MSMVSCTYSLRPIQRYYSKASIILWDCPFNAYVGWRIFNFNLEWKFQTCMQVPMATQQSVFWTTVPLSGSLNIFYNKLSVMHWCLIHVRFVQALLKWADLCCVNQEGVITLEKCAHRGVVQRVGSATHFACTKQTWNKHQCTFSLQRFV